MEYSIVQLSEVESFSRRLDAGYYGASAIEAEKLLKRGDWDYLKGLAQSIKSFGAYSLNNAFEYRNDGIPFLRAIDIKGGLIDFSRVLHIDDQANRLLWKSEIKPESTLLTMSGTVGESSVTTAEMSYPMNSSQDVAKIVMNGRANPYYLSVFLQSSYGKAQISRLPIGSVQQHIFLWQIEKLVVPLLRREFQASVESVFKAMLLVRKKSNDAYEQAQSLLLSELGLANWQPKHKLSFVKNFSDTRHPGRIDADYFQPQYEEIVAAIKSYPGGWDTLGNLTTIKKGFEVGSEEYLEEGIPFVRVSNLSPFEITEEKYISKRLYAMIQGFQPEQGEILLSKDATPGIAHYLDEPPPRMIPASGVLRLKSKTDKINDECLALILNSMLTKKQANRDVGGSVIVHWRPKQIAETVVPILSPETQNQIRQMVTESASLRRQSKRLLECAKRAVEIAIEQDEQTAIAWLDSETNTQNQPGPLRPGGA